MPVLATARATACVAIMQIVLFALPFVRAEAAIDCRPAGAIGPGLRKLIQAFQASEHSGRGTLAVQDFLVGVTNIKAADQAALDHRGPVKVTRTGAGQGTVLNEGQGILAFDAIFAASSTYFKIPQSLKAHYLTKANSLVLYYEADNALHLGEALPLIGPVYHSVNHVAISADKLLFFWGDNAGDDPDRCYVPS